MHDGGSGLRLNDDPGLRHSSVGLSLAGSTLKLSLQKIGSLHARADDGSTLNTGWLGSFVSFRGYRPILLGNPYIFVIFQGEGSGLPVPPLDPHMNAVLSVPSSFAMISLRKRGLVALL